MRSTLRFHTIALILLALAIAANTFGLTGKAANGVAQTNACIATNIQRATDNASHLADYRFESQQIRFTRGSLRANYAALRKIGLSRRVLNRALRQSEASLRTEQAQASTKTWTSLSNCAASPGAREALAIHLISSSIPPRSARSVTNALRTDPVGSVQ